MDIVSLKSKKAIILIGVVLLATIVTGWVIIQGMMKPKILRISTTTSLYGTELLDYLGEKFEEWLGQDVVVQFIAVGSGEALEKAKRGDVDMVLVHAPNLEYEYIREGVLENGSIFAYNTFIIAGPTDDPAGISGLDPISAMKRIYEYFHGLGSDSVVGFVSRGDNSGTHVREKLLWKLANVSPYDEGWYMSTGSGMTDTLLVANEKEAYVLTDIGTYLKLKSEGRLNALSILVSEGKELLNIYSAYIVSEKYNPQRNLELAIKFLEFLTSHEGQELIDSYKVDELGQHLFYKAEGREDWLESSWLWFVYISYST